MYVRGHGVAGDLLDLCGIAVIFYNEDEMKIFENKDCMQGMKEYPDKYFDLAIVDPPDGGGGKRRSRRKV